MEEDRGIGALADVLPLVVPVLAVPVLVVPILMVEDGEAGGVVATFDEVSTGDVVVDVVLVAVDELFFVPCFPFNP